MAPRWHRHHEMAPGWVVKVVLSNRTIHCHNRPLQPHSHKYCAVACSAAPKPLPSRSQATLPSHSQATVSLAIRQPSGVESHCWIPLGCPGCHGGLVCERGERRGCIECIEKPLASVEIHHRGLEQSRSNFSSARRSQRTVRRIRWPTCTRYKKVGRSDYRKVLARLQGSKVAR